MPWMVLHVHSFGDCGTVDMSYLEHSLKAYDYTKTVQSLRMLGWKNQSWRTRNQQGLVVAAGNFPLEYPMEEQLDPGSAASNLLLILVTSTTTKLPTIISTWAAGPNSQLRTVCSFRNRWNKIWQLAGRSARITLARTCAF